MSKARVAVLISGRGSNMAALIEAAKNPAYPAEIVLVLSNIADAGGLDIAEAEGIETAVIAHAPFGKDREAHERMIDARLRQSDVQIVALAGYMRVLTPYLVTTGVDEGPILGQAEVDVLPDDDEDLLGARVLEQEHQLYARCLADLVRGLGL